MHDEARLMIGAIAGLCLGSFANVLVVRLHQGRSLFERSCCPRCGRVLLPAHLVPVFSWLYLRGRCAFCRAPISGQYPLVELAGMAIGLITAFRVSPYGPTALSFVVELCLLMAVLVLVIMDIRWRELPLSVMVASGLGSAVVRLYEAQQAGMMGGFFEGRAMALGIVCLLLGVPWALSQGSWLGGGDVWFGFMMALALGWPGVAIALYIALVGAGLVAGILFLFGSLKRTVQVPLAPALALGMAAALWFQDPIIHSIVRRVGG